MRVPLASSQEDRTGNMRERDRFAQLLLLLGRHGLRGLAARLGFGAAAADELEAARPEAVVAVLRDVGPVGVKFGQILAMRNDLLGPDWIAALSTLQDRVPPLPFDEIEPVIRETIGGPIERAFSNFEPEALAAASIAQVHAATLLDGTSVIVKVRRPGIERIVDADLRLLRRLARAAERRVPEIARMKPDELLRCFAESLDREMDLSAEGRSSEAVGAFLGTLGIRTARFHWEISGRRMNVQERIEGIKATDLDAARLAGFDLQELARSYAQAVLRMIIFNGQFHADPHPGNVFFTDGTLAFIDFGAVGNLLPRRRVELVRLALAIAAEDTAAVVDILMDWAGDPDVDRHRLELALAELIERFRNVVLDQVDLAEIFELVFRLLRDFQLALPPDLALVLRTLLTAEGFVRRIDPRFDIAAELAPLARELIAERASPRRLRAEARKLLSAAGRAALSAPDMIGQIEKVARTGAIPITLAKADLDKLSGADRRSVAGDPQILPAALLISAAILVPSIPLLSGGALAVAVLMIAWTKLGRD
jgi:ubiquinone biosynthesis protein